MCTESQRHVKRRGNLEEWHSPKMSVNSSWPNPHIGALSVADGTERGPLTVPIWYLYSPGGKPWILTGKDSRKARLIESAGHFSLMAERLDPTIRYVSVSGSVDKIGSGHRRDAGRSLAALPGPGQGRRISRIRAIAVGRTGSNLHESAALAVCGSRGDLTTLRKAKARRAGVARRA